MPARLSLVLGFVVCIAALAWLFFAERRADEGDARRARPQPFEELGETATDVRLVAGRLDEGDRAQARDPLEERPAPEAAAPTDVARTFEREPLPAEHFDATLGHLTEDELAARLTESHSRYQADLERIFAEREAAGAYTVDRREPIPGGGIHRWSTGDQGPRSPIRRLEIDPAAREAKVFEIPYPEHRDVYDLRDEISWLLGRTGAMPGRDG